MRFVRNAPASVPRSAAQWVAATIRTAFGQPDAESTQAGWRRVRERFAGRFRRLAALLDEAEADAPTCLAFAPEHWRRIRSNTPLRRLNNEA